MDQFKDVSAQKTSEPPYLRKRRNKFKQRQDPYVGHLMVNNEGQHVIQPLYSTGTRGVSLPPPITLGKPYNECIDEYEEEKENMAPMQYYPTCHCQQHYANMYYNPHGYYYAPASLYFSPRSDESDEHINKRKRKHRRKSRGYDDLYNHNHEHTGRRGNARVKSAYISNRIPLHIVPTMRDNRMLLHAYPLNDPYSAQGYPNIMKEPVPVEKSDPVYVKKLEYSADKLAMSSRKHKKSDQKKSAKKQDHSLEVDNKSKEYFDVNKRDRKNTLSGHKRTFNSQDNSVEKCTCDF